MCSSDPPDNKPHSLKDHQWGIDADHGHEHGEGADHDHDHDHLDGPPTEGDRTLWAQDNVILRSVGIDIGSAGTQLVFSRLHLQRISEELSTRYVTIDREQLYQSPIALTPYQSEALIDAAALGGIIERAYAACGLHPDDIDTGAVILHLTDGTLAVLGQTRHDPRGYDVRMEIIGSKDAVTVGLGANTPLRPLDADAPSMPGPAWTTFLTRFEPAYRAELLAFLRVARGEIPSPCTARDGLEAMRISEAATRSRLEHRPVRLNEIA